MFVEASCELQKQSNDLLSEVAGGLFLSDQV